MLYFFEMLDTKTFLVAEITFQGCSRSLDTM